MGAFARGEGESFAIRMSYGNAMSDIVGATMRGAHSAGAWLYWRNFGLYRMRVASEGKHQRLCWIACIAWQNFFTKRFDVGLLVLSKHAGSVSDASESLSFSMRLFEQLALPTSALLLQFGHGGGSPQGGGCRGCALASAARRALRTSFCATLVQRRRASPSTSSSTSGGSALGLAR